MADGQAEDGAKGAKNDANKNDADKNDADKKDGSQKQLLHLVFGGELSSIAGIQFKDLDALDFVGIFPNYASAYVAWKAKAQSTVDNAQMRYFIVHLHRLLDPS
jgi:hypothetical protein